MHGHVIAHSDDIAKMIENSAGVIATFFDIWRKRSTAQRGAHLFGHRMRGALKQRQFDGIDGLCRILHGLFPRSHVDDDVAEWIYARITPRKNEGRSTVFGDNGRTFECVTSSESVAVINRSLKYSFAKRYAARFQDCRRALDGARHSSRHLDGLCLRRNAHSDIHGLDHPPFIRIAVTPLVSAMKTAEHPGIIRNIQFVSLSDIAQVDRTRHLPRQSFSMEF